MDIGAARELLKAAVAHELSARIGVPLKKSKDKIWVVMWGGDTRKLNQHHGHGDQHRAIDIVMGDERSSHVGKGKLNKDYHGWGRDVLAPADGRVIEAVDGIKDNVPGEENKYHLPGNSVSIQHSGGNVSLLAHLQSGSVRVKAGDRVRRGEVIGRIGNSGSSTAPHLHFQVNRGRDPVKVLFDSVKVTRGRKSETRKDYSPIRGDIISP